MWYVINPPSQACFEKSVASQVMDKEYINDHYGGSRQIRAMKIVLFNPSILLDRNRDVMVPRNVQKKRWFINKAPGAYHRGFNVVYNVTQAKNFGDFSWAEGAKNFRRKL